MLATLNADHFSSHLHDTFRVHTGDDQVVEVELIEVRNLGESTASSDGKRAPFSLLFRGPADLHLEQRIFAVSHQAVGSLDIFLVPVGPDDTGGARFEAIFN